MADKDIKLAARAAPWGGRVTWAATAGERGENLYRDLVEQIDAITYIRHPGAGFLFISPQVSMLGYTPAEWLAQPSIYQHLLHDEDRAAALDAFTLSAATGAPLCQEYRLLSRSGVIRWFRDQARPQRAPWGELVCMHGILVDITRHKSAQFASADSQRRLRELLAHQDLAREHERRSIASELHDEVGGLLTGIRACLLTAQGRCASRPDELAALLADASNMAGDALVAVRDVATGLRSGILQQLGVWAAIEWQVQQLERHTAMRCTCQLVGCASGSELGAERGLQIFRIVQEALANVVRHACAKAVAVVVTERPRLLTVSVVDDGIGIGATGAARGAALGLLCMQERAQRLNGALSIAEAAGGGTAVTLTLPIGPADGG